MKLRLTDIGRQITAGLILAGILTAVTSAGELSNKLAQTVAGKASTELVRVWIELPEVETPASLKATAKALATTRSERHKMTFERLREKHSASQRDLLTHLKTLSGGNKASQRRVKGHWIINVIEAEVTVEQLYALADRADIETIHAVPRIVSIAPDKVSSAPTQSLAPIVEDNLKHIRADLAWLNGYTGAGRVICSFDTGIDGLHPALYDSWKGHDGDAAAAWFDPVGGEAFPHTLPGVKPTHGTSTMGLILGHDDATGDTVGVALDAKWISAGVIDVPGASIIDAFEWAADPDGDPNSIDDVPDVINHSWGVQNLECENVFFKMIDATEALGIVNIFAAGNEGNQGSMTIRNPANRANDSLDCFAVGSIDHRADTIAASSSRGPSDCNFAIKPNVVAPGVLVRFPVPDGLYGVANGTSFAAPHVSGLVAILRQKNPNATVDEIKEAIIGSTDRLGISLPNNTYGWGLIDCWAALGRLSDVNASPNVKIYSFNHAQIDPGDIVTGTLVLKNFGASVSGVTASLVDDNPALTVLAGTASFGAIAEGAMASADAAFRVQVSDTVSEGSVLALDLNIDGTGYSTTAKLYIAVGPQGERSFVTHSTGTLDFSVSNYGTYGFGPGSYYELGGAGFDFLEAGNDLFDGGLMIGVRTDQVSDGAEVPLNEPDGDFGVVSGGTFEFVTPMAGIAQQSFSRFTDDRAEEPIGVTVEQHTYSFDTSPNQDYVLLQYVIRNTGSASLNNLYVGMFCDWDVISAGTNVGGYEATDDFAWVAYSGTITPMQYRGVKVLYGYTATAYTDSIAGFDYFDDSKMDAMRRGISSPDSWRTGTWDLFQVVASRTSLDPGQVDTVTFAVMAGETLADIQATALATREAYIEFVLNGVPPPPPPLPDKFTLNQNYPNPFNSGTTVTFNLETATRYKLSLYDILGRKIRHWTGQDGPGEVEIPISSDGMASGIYLYRLDAGNFKASRKMVLIK